MGDPEEDGVGGDSGRLMTVPLPQITLACPLTLSWAVRGDKCH